MKLNQKRGESSFYESFSDLVFGALVLMIVIVAALAAKTKQTAARTESVVDELKMRQAELAANLAKSQEELNALEEALRVRPVELVIAVDVTGSMTASLELLKKNMQSMARLLPYVAPDFRVGVVAYNQAKREPLDEFKLRSLSPRVTGNDEAAKDFESWIGNLKAEQGLAPVHEAIERSLQMLHESTADPGFRKVLVLVGDVGPLELRDSNQPNGYVIDPSRAVHEAAVYKAVKAWVQGHEARRVVCIFAGTAPQPGNVVDPRYQPSREFFQGVAQAAGHAEDFTDDGTRMIELIMRAAIPPR